MTDIKEVPKNKKLIMIDEMAQAEFDRFVDIMDLDLNGEDMDGEDKADCSRLKAVMIKAIRRGSLIINDEGEPIFTPQREKNAEAIKFEEPTGYVPYASDSKKGGQVVAKMYAQMAAMSNQQPKRFVAMKMPDLKVCTAIYTLFLA